MNELNVVQRTFDLVFRSRGFEKKSGAWYGQSNEVISVTDLQKSQYSPRYYVNQAFWIRELGGGRYPREVDCHIRMRLDDLLDDEQQVGVLDDLLNLNKPMSDSDRIAGLTSLLDRFLFPAIKRGDSVEGLRSMRKSGEFDAAAVRGAALMILGT